MEKLQKCDKSHMVLLAWKVIDKDYRRWMDLFIHQSGMLLVWQACKHLTQSLGMNSTDDKRYALVNIE